MKKMTLTLLLGSLMLSAAPAQAGFFMEGLEPYVVRYCDGSDPAVTDPHIAPPASVYEETSPDATWLEGKPAYDSPNCASKGKATGGGTKAPKTYKVPQK